MKLTESFIFSYTPLFGSQSDVKPQQIFGKPLHLESPAVLCFYLQAAIKHPMVSLPLWDETQKKKKGRISKCKAFQNGDNVKDPVESMKYNTTFVSQSPYSNSD